MQALDRQPRPQLHLVMPTAATYDRAEAQRRMWAVRLIRLRKLADRRFDAYQDEAIGDPETPGIARFDGPCHIAWHKAFRAYTTAYHAYLARYGVPAATLYGVYGPMHRAGVIRR